MDKFDTIVLGLGAMGAATAYQLAKRGTSVLGIDRFAPPHDRGSSHGESRITRLAIGEGTHYTPLAMRSHEIWREVEKETGSDLLTVTGGLMISSARKTSKLHVENFFGNTVAAAERYGIAHQMLDSADIRQRFPQFNIRDGETGYYEYDAGFLRPEACVAAQIALARKHGAEIHPGETVLGFDASDRGVTLRTDKGTYAAERLVISAGAWLPELLGGEYAKIFKIYRQLLFWFAVKGPIAPFEKGTFPIFIWELQGPDQAIYGFPAIDGARGGVKVATQQYRATTTPETVNRNISDEEIAAMYENSVAPYLPALDRECLKAVSCLYTVTPDAGFVIDAHPKSERVLIVSPCSGHGLKHSAAIGEAIAQRIIDGQSRLDLSAFTFARL